MKLSRWSLACGIVFATLILSVMADRGNPQRPLSLSPTAIRAPSGGTPPGRGTARLDTGSGIAAGRSWFSAARAAESGTDRGSQGDETAGGHAAERSDPGAADPSSVDNREGMDLGSSFKVQVPLFGELDVRGYSIPTLAVLLGLIDGFNPCAMWALVYLISLVVSLNDKRKIWLIVGTFVWSSGVLYFLFMTAWLNTFIFLGYLRPITTIIGVVSVYVGVAGLIDLIRTRGAVACKVVGASSKDRTMNRMRQVVFSPVTLSTMLSIVALAFIVNSMEFLCSCAIPAVFTHVLAISGLSSLEHYGYILLYDLFFMLDDFIIFASAAFAFNAMAGNRYLAYSRSIGGLLLIGLGLVLVFAPQWLTMG